MTTLTWVFCIVSLFLGWIAFGLLWILGSAICTTTKWYDSIITFPVNAIMIVVLAIGDWRDSR